MDKLSFEQLKDLSTNKNVTYSEENDVSKFEIKINNPIDYDKIMDKAKTIAEEFIAKFLPSFGTPKNL